MTALTYPFRRTVLHVVPKDDLSAGDRYADGYRMLGRELRQEVIGSARDVLGLGLGTGGVPHEWWCGEEQMLNAAGFGGRSIAETMFLSNKEGLRGNPTMGGDKFDAYMDGQYKIDHTDRPPRGCAYDDWIHGAKITRLENRAGVLTIESIPLEWDPDGMWPNNPAHYAHGGNVMAAVECSDLRFRLMFREERPGLYRVEARAVLSTVAPLPERFVWGAIETFPRFGFDTILAYNGETAGLQDLTTLAIPGTSTGTFGTLKDRQTRMGFSDKIQVAPNKPVTGGEDVSGTYENQGVFGQKGNAVLYRAFPAQIHPWSFGRDLCWGFWVPRITPKIGNKPWVHLDYTSSRDHKMPTNGARDIPVMHVSVRHEWHQNCEKPPDGLLHSTAYILVGTWQEALDNLDYLRQEDPQ